MGDDEPLSRSDLRAVVDERLEALEGLIVRHPFTLAHANAALERVDAKIPPNEPGNQQFKDSAIWEALLDMAEEHEIIFVTADKGFFEGRDPRKGPANELLEDCAKRHVHIKLVFASSQDVVLRELDVSSVDIPRAQVFAAVQGAVAQRLEREASHRGFVTSEPREGEVTAYVTATPHVLAVSFSFEEDMRRVDPSKADRPATLRVTGQCTYDPSSAAVSDVEINLLVAQIADDIEVWALQESQLFSAPGIIEVPLK